MGLDPSTHAPKEEANPTAPQEYEALAFTRHQAQWENARLEAEARFSRESLIMFSGSTAGYHTDDNTVETITMPNDDPPADYFLKLWNSEAGKVFRKEYHHRNGGGDDPVLLSEIPLTSVSSLCYASTQNSCDEYLYPNDKGKDNGSQQCNFASFKCNGDSNVKNPEIIPCFGHMTMGQTEDKAAEELGAEDIVHYPGFDPELLMDFPDNDNNNNTYSIQSEMSPGFQLQSSSPWPELHDEDYWSNM